MAQALKCAVCKVEMTTADADHAVKTDAGPVHRECFDGPVPPLDLPDEVDQEFLKADDAATQIGTWSDEEIEAEEEARRGHNDVPLPEGIGVVNGIICADDRSRRRIHRMVREDLDAPLDPDRRF